MGGIALGLLWMKHEDLATQGAVLPFPTLQLVNLVNYMYQMANPPVDPSVHLAFHCTKMCEKSKSTTFSYYENHPHYPAWPS